LKLHPSSFRVYPERWWLLLTVVLLNLANYSHWVAFASVAKNAAKYYDQVRRNMSNGRKIDQMTIK
jgi:hypothetical protein